MEPVSHLAVHPQTIPRQVPIYSYIFVTVPEKRAHFRQYFQIELLVLNGRVALKQLYGVYFLS